VSFSWDFGDGQTATGGPTISHSYATVGPKTVTLGVSDPAGQRASTTRALTITPSQLLGAVKLAAQTRRSALAHGIRFNVSCNEPCVIGSRASLRALVQSSRRHKKPKLIGLGNASSRLAAAGQAQLTIPLNRAAKRLLKRLHSPVVTITISATSLNAAAPPLTGATTANLRLSG
jgi:PKD repeat protein